MLQHSPEWYAARLGKVTASRVVDIMPGPRGYSVKRERYKAELLQEIATGQPAPRFESEAMRWGTDMESEARCMFEIETGLIVVEDGFILHPTCSGFGASPDGLIELDSGLEIKCPSTNTHNKTIATRDIKIAYQYQMQSAMACTGRDHWYFMSYDPRAEQPIYISRIERNVNMIDAILHEIQLFWGMG